MEEVITEVNPDFIIVIVADYPNNDGYLPVIGGTVIPLSAKRLNSVNLISTFAKTPTAIISRKITIKGITNIGYRNQG